MYIGIDIGGTFIKYGVINEFGVSIEKASIATNHTKEILFADLVELVKTYQKKYPSIVGVGISAPGVILKDGTMQTAGSIQSLYGANIKELIERECQILTIVENDANAAAIAEQWIGNAEGIQNYICLVIGTGIGGGIVINGELFQGAHGRAGEFGWMLVKDMPKTGSIETASFNQRASVIGGLCFQYQKELKRQGINEVITDARLIFNREASGDCVAEKVIANFFEDLAVGLINLISNFDPELILIGGAISSDAVFMQRLSESMKEALSRHKSLAYVQQYQIATLAPTKLQNDAGMIGAVYQVHKKVQKGIRK